MNWAPIVIFGYNRADHLERTIKALQQNEGAAQSEVTLFLDGSKGDKDRAAVERVHALGDTFAKSNSFRSFTVVKKQTNEGLARSVISGVSEIIKKHGSVIVLEDDIVTSRDFLSFMNQALLFYKDESKIWSISGYTFNLDALSSVKEDVYVAYRASSWGWATWQDRWETVDWSVSDYEKFRYRIDLRARFNRGGTNMANMLDRQMAGEISSWAIRWCYSQSKQNKLTIFPCKSKVLNIGQDGSGTHSNTVDQYDSNMFGEGKFEFCLPPLNKNILRQFRKRTGLSIASRTKRYVIYNILRKRK